jgi:hypothetical protein
MTWDEHYTRWRDAKAARRGAEAHDRLQAARQRVSENTPEDWEWLRTALRDTEKKWFVALVFIRQPIPRRLFADFMQAAVVDVDPSTNEWLLRPCLETYGRDAVLGALDRLKSLGVVPEERIGWALYWCRREPREARGTPPKRDE